MTGQSWAVDSDHTLDEFLKHAAELYAKHRHVTFSWSSGRQRTVKQNSALHLYFQLLADALNDAGLDMRKVLKEGVDIPWTKDQVKNHLWRPLQEIIIGVESTREPNRDEYSKVYDTLHRHMAQKFGVSVLWPEAGV